ncbi:MAG: class I SAM-dependent methyltransferase [Planctomycetes bacterium]|nr:class I SAM-dependent methyltransferase [Planctomycetota bacterium]
MPQITSGPRSILDRPTVYSLLQNLVGARKARRAIVDDYARPKSGESVLDIGCGPADILEFLPDVQYYGFDLSTAYIETARRRYGSRGTFRDQDVTTADLAGLPRFDLVLTLFSLHHLADPEVQGLFTLAARQLKSGGRMVTIDPCLIEGQHPIARWLILRDRGQNMRSPEGYAALARPVFSRVELSTRDDLLNIPYNHAILHCQNV